MSAENPNRQPAKRVFIGEMLEATEQFTETEAEDGTNPPKLTLLPSGDKANRVFLVGVATETTYREDSDIWTCRVADPTGTVSVSAGQYDPDPQETMRDIEPPEFVAVKGKFSHYTTDDGDPRVSLNAEEMVVVDEETRDFWVQETAHQTLQRLQAEENHSEESDREYVADAEEKYGSREAVKETLIEALEESDVAAAPTTPADD